MTDEKIMDGELEDEEHFYPLPSGGTSSWIYHDLITAASMATDELFKDMRALVGWFSVHRPDVLDAIVEAPWTKDASGWTEEAIATEIYRIIKRPSTVH